jgi:3-phenylpropionate/trans-cinnamate dioxygenase ferredoxin subunit
VRDRNPRERIPVWRRERVVARVEVAPVEELPPGSMRLVPAGALTIGVFNCAGALYAIEDRCSHDDGALCEGDWEPELCVVVCPRHGARFDLQTGIPMTLPAFESVPVYPVSVRDDGVIVVEVPD